ncbi:MAG: tetratricopeptide repeat protein [Planctomycetes bacterium]|nr:tetratricopeptide repeat protein [Planctomycetota bacterium]
MVPPGAAELGAVHLRVSTTSAAAQEAFDQGLAWCYGFHHDEARRCFGEAIAADPGCAMAHWGLAYASGPHINNMEMSEDMAREANAAAQRAHELAGNATPRERALIDAIVRRYAWPAPKERGELDRAYAAAMRDVYREHGDEPHTAALFAEALMDLRPWDLWSQEGEPREETLEVLEVLDRLLAAHPDHPQGNHLYIHAVEASPQPERASAAADRLRALPNAAGHLVHMPSHAYVRVGRYEEGAEANRLGIAADLRLVARTGRVGFYELYRAHNYHFLAYCSMFSGRDDEAIAASQQMLAELPMDVVQQMAPFLEGFLGTPYEVLVRFGRWDEMLAAPEPAEWQKGTRALWHFGRGVALAAKGDVEAARRERDAYRAAVAAVPQEWTFGNNPMHAVLAVGDAFLDGEVEFRAGDPEAAFAALRTAVARNDALRYDEPWGWMMPPRHGLGALLLEAGRFAEAEQVYRDDLTHNPDNGWALHGLAECLQQQGRTADADAARRRFAAAWRHATVQIAASCFCRRVAAR